MVTNDDKNCSEWLYGPGTKSAGLEGIPVALSGHNQLEFGVMLSFTSLTTIPSFLGRCRSSSLSRVGSWIIDGTEA